MPSSAALFLTLRAAAGQLPSGALDTLTRSMLGSLVVVALGFAGWVFRYLMTTVREQRATIDGLNLEFRKELAPLLVRTAEALDRAVTAIDGPPRGARSR